MMLIGTRIRTLNILYIFVTSFLIATSCKKEENPEPSDLPDGDFKVVTYVPGWRDIDFTKIPAQNITHINYAFAEVKNGVITTTQEKDSAILVDLVGLKSKNVDLKVLI